MTNVSGSAHPDPTIVAGLMKCLRYENGKQSKP